MPQTFYTATEYQLIYYYNLMKYNLKKQIKTGCIFYIINVHPVFCVEVYMSSDLCVTRELSHHSTSIEDTGGTLTI